MMPPNDCGRTPLRRVPPLARQGAGGAEAAAMTCLTIPLDRERLQQLVELKRWRFSLIRDHLYDCGRQQWSDAKVCSHKSL